MRSIVNGIQITFRENGFESSLGASGCQNVASQDSGRQLGWFVYIKDSVGPQVLPA